MSEAGGGGGIPTSNHLETIASDNVGAGPLNGQGGPTVMAFNGGRGIQTFVGVEHMVPNLNNTICAENSGRQVSPDPDVDGDNDGCAAPGTGPVLKGA